MSPYGISNHLDYSFAKERERYRFTMRSWVITVDLLQNSRFFLKISEEIGLVWRKSVTRAKRASLTRP